MHVMRRTFSRERRIADGCGDCTDGCHDDEREERKRDGSRRRSVGGVVAVRTARRRAHGAARHQYTAKRRSVSMHYAASNHSGQYTNIHCKKIFRISRDILWLVVRNLTEPVRWRPALRYSVDLLIRTYTEPVPLKYGKLAAKYPRIYGHCLQCSIEESMQQQSTARPTDV